MYAIRSYYGSRRSPYSTNDFSKHQARDPLLHAPPFGRVASAGDPRYLLRRTTLHDSCEGRLKPANRPAVAVRSQTMTSISPVRLTHLQRLEAESIHIMREVVAEADRPVMLYSVITSYSIHYTKLYESSGSNACCHWQ